MYGMYTIQHNVLNYVTMVVTLDGWEGGKASYSGVVVNVPRLGAACTGTMMMMMMMMMMMCSDDG